MLSCCARWGRAPLPIFIGHSSNFCISVVWMFFGSPIACPSATASTRCKIAEPSAQNLYSRDSRAGSGFRCPSGKCTNKLHCQLAPCLGALYQSPEDPSRAFLPVWRNSAPWKDDDEYIVFPGLGSPGQHSHNKNDLRWKRWSQNFWKDFSVFPLHRAGCLSLPRWSPHWEMW